MKKDKFIKVKNLIKKGKKLDVPRLMKHILGDEVYREVFSLTRSTAGEELRSEIEVELGEKLFSVIEIFCQMDMHGLKFAQELFPNFFRVLKTASPEDYEKLGKEFVVFNVKMEEKKPTLDYLWYLVIEQVIKSELLKQLDGKPVPEGEIGVEATWRIEESYPEVWTLLEANKFRDPGEKWRKVLRAATRGKIDLQTQFELNKKKLESLEKYLPEFVESCKKRLYITDDPKDIARAEKEMEKPETIKRIQDITEKFEF